MKRLALYAVFAAFLPALAGAQFPVQQPAEQQQPAETGRRGFFRRNQPTPVPAAPVTPMPVMPEEIAPQQPPPAERAQPASTPRPRRTPAPERTPARRESVERRESKPETAEKKTTDAEKKPEVTKKTPEEQAREKLAQAVDKVTTAMADFLNAANKGLYAQAASMLTPQFQKYFESEASLASGGIKAALDAITHDGAIRRWQLTTSVRGEGARVQADIEYATGISERREFELLQINGDWKILMPMGEAAKPKPLPSIPPSQRAKAPDAAPAVPTPAPVSPDLTPGAPASPVDALPVRPGSPTETTTTEAGPKLGGLAPVADTRLSANPNQTTPSAISDAPWGAKINPSDIIGGIKQ
ncbi:MAG: hypothetical protein N2111_12475 [Candidatus Sumerlaeaceae bacterium]|nr:hypothetical protein [Candidatus Sumerlaeaceae bacterium]